MLGFLFLQPPPKEHESSISNLQEPWSGTLRHDAFFSHSFTAWSSSIPCRRQQQRITRTHAASLQSKVGRTFDEISAANLVTDPDVIALSFVRTPSSGTLFPYLAPPPLPPDNLTATIYYAQSSPTHAICRVPFA